VGCTIKHEQPGLSTYESLHAISRFFPDVFLEGGRLASEFPEFSKDELPPKEEWIQKRVAGEKW
jgi:hypothetical protein